MAMADCRIFHPQQAGHHALPDGHFHRLAAFALLHIKGRKPITRLVEGPMTVERIYDQGLQAQGYRKGGHEGLPRLPGEVSRRLPFGTVTLSEMSRSAACPVTGWSPFVPDDDVASGIPAAILEYTLHNPIAARRSSASCRITLSHLAVGKAAKRHAHRVIPGRASSLQY